MHVHERLKLVRFINTSDSCLLEVMYTDIQGSKKDTYPLRFTTIRADSIGDNMIFPSLHNGHLQGKLKGMQHPAVERKLKSCLGSIKHTDVHTLNCQRFTVRG